MDSKENKYRFVRHIEQSESRIILRPSSKEHGAAPKADPILPRCPATRISPPILFDGLQENNVDFVVGLPCSGLSAAQALCMNSQSMRYVAVAHEGTGLGLCAGAWLGGKRPAALMENFGLFASTYHLLRGHYSYGIPTLIVLEFRGDAGDQEFFAESGEMTEPLLAAARINYRMVQGYRRLEAGHPRRPALDGFRHASLCGRAGVRAHPPQAGRRDEPRVNVEERWMIVDAHACTRSRRPSAARATTRAAALALGLFFTPPVSSVIEAIANAVAPHVAASIGNLGFISPAQGGPAALSTSQSDALAAYNNALDQFKSILRQRRAQIELEATAAEPAGTSTLSCSQRHDERLQGPHRRASVQDRKTQ